MEMLAKIHRRALLATALITAATVAAPAWSADTFKVGAINPYSGATALYGTEVTRGYELAADALNAKGGLLGKQIEIVRGNATSPQEGIAAVEQLAGRDKVDVFIGTYLSAVSQSASEAALNYNKLYWDTNALAANLTDRGLPNFVRSGPYSASFAKRSVDFVTDLVAKQLGKKPSELKVWIEHEDSIYGTSIAQQQEEELKKAGVQVVGIGAHNYKAIDLTDSVLRAKNAQPDVWLQTGYVPDGNLLLRTARDQGFKPAATVFVGTGDTKETLEAMGRDSIEGLYVVSYPRPDISEKFGPGSSAYLAAYKAKYNQDPVAPQSMAAYVGFQMMAEAVTAAGSADPAAVKAVLPKFDKPESSYATGFGVKYDEKAQNTRAFPTVIQWQSGKQVTIYPVAAAGDHKPVMPGK
jgi:branched-chain amino acid transport system substrate-binding protein